MATSWEGAGSALCAASKPHPHYLPGQGQGILGELEGRSGYVSSHRVFPSSEGTASAFPLCTDTGCGQAGRDLNPDELHFSAKSLWNCQEAQYLF